MRGIGTQGLMMGLFAVAGFVLLLWAADDAEATHYYGGTLDTTVEPLVMINGQSPVSGTVTFGGQMAWRGSAVGSPAVGACVPGPGVIQWGDGNTAAFDMQVARSNSALDTVVAYIKAPGCQTMLQHVYSATALDSATYTISWTHCCRPATDKYNPNQQTALKTAVDPLSPNASPRDFGTLYMNEGIVACAIQSDVCEVQMRPNDPDGDTLTYRFATPCEADPSCQYKPLSNLGAAMDSSGRLTWNTSAYKDGLYAVQVMVGDGKTEVPIDFLLDVGSTTKNIAPVADFTWAGPVYAGQPVTFTSTSTDADGTVALWRWYFYDGQPNFATAPNATTTFATPGNKYVRLTVYDDDGAYGYAYAYVEVLADEPPVAAMHGNGTGTSWTFSDASHDDFGIVAWYWDFGDGTNSTAQSPTHRFAPGTYQVTLVVYDASGNKDSVTHTIHAPCQQACTV